MISLAALKEYLRVDADLTADDDLITEIETAAVAYLENETGRYFGPIVELTETLNGNGWAPVFLRGDPNEDEDYGGGPLVVERRTFPNGDWETMAAGVDFEVDGNRLYPLVFWTPGTRTLRVTYWAGYEEGDEPEDIQQAVRELVVRMYNHRSPVVTGSVVAELPFSVSQIIRAHRIPAF